MTDGGQEDFLEDPANLNHIEQFQRYLETIAGTLRSHRRGEVLFRKGDRSDSMYAVISGELQVVDLPPHPGGPREAHLPLRGNPDPSPFPSRRSRF